VRERCSHLFYTPAACLAGAVTGLSQHIPFTEYYFGTVLTALKAFSIIWEFCEKGILVMVIWSGLWANYHKCTTICTLNKNMNATFKVLVPCFMSWNKGPHKCSICRNILFLSNSVHKLVYNTIIKHLSFDKIIHPPDRCGISRSWLNSIIIIQEHLVLWTIKGHSKMCFFATQHNATDVSRCN
jgi:hypothetical protein